MSTKITVAYSDNFHLYEEAFEDDGGLYLEMTGPAARATIELGYYNWADGATGAVTVWIPRAIWNQIVKVGERNERKAWPLPEEEESTSPSAKQRQGQVKKQSKPRPTKRVVRARKK